MEKINIPRLLVIGGTGFIGHHLLKTVQQKGWEITSISLNSPTKGRYVDGVRYLHFDMSDRILVKRNLVEEFNYVVNLSGYINHRLFMDDGRRLIETHFIALQNLLEFLPRGKLERFVQIGSSDEYGNKKAPQHEDLREQPISPYSLAKVASTYFLQMLHQTENFPSVILRLFLTYGPGQDMQRFLPQTIRGCLEDNPFPTSSGEQLRDFCHVDDTITAIMHALDASKVEGEVFNIATGKPITIREVIQKVCKITGYGNPQYGHLPYRPGENMALYANISKAKKFLHWEPEITLDEGLKKTIDWYTKDHV